MSNDKNMALNQQAEEEVSSATTPVEEPKATEEIVEPKPKATAEVKVEAVETEKEEPKKGLNSRVRELNTRAKEAEEKAKSLEEKLTELTDQARSPAQTAPAIDVSTQSPQEPILKPGEEIDTNELERRMKVREDRILQQARGHSDLQMKQSEAISRIKTEASEAVRKYPELDTQSEHFNRELSDTVTEAVEAKIKSEPYTASVVKFVDKLMKPYKGAVTKAVGKQKEELAKQASQGAIKPTAVRKQETSAQEKSIAELEQELGIVQP